VNSAAFIEVSRSQSAAAGFGLLQCVGLIGRRLLRGDRSLGWLCRQKVLD